MRAVIGTISASNLAHARPNVDVKRIRLRRERVDAVQEIDVRGIAVVDRTRHVAALPAGSFARRERFHDVERRFRPEPVLPASASKRRDCSAPSSPSGDGALRASRRGSSRCAGARGEALALVEEPIEHAAGTPAQPRREDRFRRFHDRAPRGRGAVHPREDAARSPVELPKLGVELVVDGAVSRVRLDTLLHANARPARRPSRARRERRTR